MTHAVIQAAARSIAAHVAGLSWPAADEEAGMYSAGAVAHFRKRLRDRLAEQPVPRGRQRRRAPP